MKHQNKNISIIYSSPDSIDLKLKCICSFCHNLTVNNMKNKKQKNGTRQSIVCLTRKRTKKTFVEVGSGNTTCNRQESNNNNNIKIHGIISNNEINIMFMMKMVNQQNNRKISLHLDVFLR